MLTMLLEVLFMKRTNAVTTFSAGIIATLAISIQLGLAPYARAEHPPLPDGVGNPFRVTTHSPDGTLVDEFIATDVDMHIDQLKIGPEGNIWLTRSDNSHTIGVPNPNDMVAVFTLDGTEIRTISGGGMRHPLGVGWDDIGSIFVSGEDDFFNSEVYKFDSSGTFLFSFHTAGWGPIDTYYDLVVRAGDHPYVTAWHGIGNVDQVTEFSGAGATVNTFSPTGATYFHRDIALSPAGTLWIRTPRNGPGDDLIREFRSDGVQTNQFNSTAAVPGSSFVGLEVGPGGEIYALNALDHVLYGFDPNGNIVSETFIQDLFTFITDFTFRPDGHVLVASRAPSPAAIQAGAPPASGARLLATPNPFSGQVALRFTAPAIGHPELAVYDVAGRLVRALDASGRTGVAAWDGLDGAGHAVADGVYFVRLTTGNDEHTVAVRKLR